MQIKTIEKAISTKISDWLSSIPDENLRKRVKDVVVVSGGCITSMLLGEPVNDYDIYLSDEKVLMDLCKYYIKPFEDRIILLSTDTKIPDIPEDGPGFMNIFQISNHNLKPGQIKLFLEGRNGGLRVNEGPQEDSLRYYPVFFSPNAISLSHDIQIVTRFSGLVEDIHKSFDFVHATNYFSFKTGLVRNLPAIESILTKRLMYQGSIYPVTSIIRAKKFIKRGWNISAGELLKIMFQISQLDLSDPVVLEDQLIGVDVAYFQLLIEALKSKYDGNPNFKVDSAYFNSLIDRIFNENSEEYE